jgi:hypothetical protein
MHVAVRFGAFAVFAVGLAACEQAPRSLIGPSSALGVFPSSDRENNVRKPEPPTPQFAALGVLIPISIEEKLQEGFVCDFNGFGPPSTNSRLKITPGVRKLECSGQAFEFTAPGIYDITFNPSIGCSLGPDVPPSADWRVVVTATGEMTLECKLQ